MTRSPSSPADQCHAAGMDISLTRSGSGQTSEASHGRVRPPPRRSERGSSAKARAGLSGAPDGFRGRRRQQRLDAKTSMRTPPLDLNKRLPHLLTISSEGGKPSGWTICARSLGWNVARLAVGARSERGRLVSFGQIWPEQNLTFPTVQGSFDGRHRSDVLGSS